MFRKSPDLGISAHGGPYSTKENLVFEGGGSFTGDFERWMKKGSLLGNSKVC